MEVEAKAPCPDASAKVKSLGAEYVKSESQTDTYFRHPVRDFSETDEALRIRRTDDLVITYKGPKHDSDLKVREEIEFTVPEDAYTLLTRLGFEEAFTVKKKRETYELDGLTICCDLVEGLGEYVEVESADPGDHDKIIAVLDKLGVNDQATTMTYSQLLNL